MQASQGIFQTVTCRTVWQSEMTKNNHFTEEWIDLYDLDDLSSSITRKKSVKKLGVQHGNHYSWGSNYHLCSVLFSLAGWQHCTVWIPHCALGEDVLPSQEHSSTWTRPGEHTDAFLLAGTEAPHLHLTTCNLRHIQLTSDTSHLLFIWWGYFTWLAAQLCWHRQKWGSKSIAAGRSEIADTLKSSWAQPCHTGIGETGAITMSYPWTTSRAPSRSGSEGGVCLGALS